MNSSRTLPGLLAAGRDAAVAIAASGAPPLGYAGLRALVGQTIASLEGFGIGRNDLEVERRDAVRSHPPGHTGSPEHAATYNRPRRNAMYRPVRG